MKPSPVPRPNAGLLLATAVAASPARDTPLKPEGWDWDCRGVGEGEQRRRRLEAFASPRGRPRRVRRRPLGEVGAGEGGWARGGGSASAIRALFRLTSARWVDELLVRCDCCCFCCCCCGCDCFLFLLLTGRERCIMSVLWKQGREGRRFKDDFCFFRPSGGLTFSVVTLDGFTVDLSPSTFSGGFLH